MKIYFVEHVENGITSYLGLRTARFTNEMWWSWVGNLQEAYVFYSEESAKTIIKHCGLTDSYNIVSFSKNETI